MSKSVRSRHVVLAAAAVAIVTVASIAAGSPTAGVNPQAGHHPAVCAKGVRTYSDIKEVPTPFDSLTLPPADGPIRVTSQEEAEAAELAMRERAGSVGATGVLVTDVTEEDAGRVTMHRSVLPVFVSADSARAQQACKP